MAHLCMVLWLKHIPLSSLTPAGDGVPLIGSSLVYQAIGEGGQRLYWEGRCADNWCNPQEKKLHSYKRVTDVICRKTRWYD